MTLPHIVSATNTVIAHSHTAAALSTGMHLVFALL